MLFQTELQQEVNSQPLAHEVGAINHSMVAISVKSVLHYHPALTIM